MPLITGMSDVRVIITFVAIGGCLIVLYPKVFSPMISNMFGGRKVKTPNTDRVDHPRSHLPPHKEGRPNQPPVGLPPNMDAEIQKHMRQHGPHPGMRHAADMKQQSKTGSGGRGGIMGMVLPVYAVGIIGYLIYTLVKVFNKSSKGEFNKKPGNGKLQTKSPNTSEESSTIEEASLSELKESSAKLSELENLLSKADDKSISTDEMRALQARLEETEKQMARILKAMQTVSSKVTDVVEAKENNEEHEEKGKSESDQNSWTGKDGPGVELATDEVAQKEREKEEGKEDRDLQEEVILLDSQKGKDLKEESSMRQRKVQVERNEH